MLIGVRPGSLIEWCVPLWMRPRWLQGGGRIVREEPGDALELVVFRAPVATIDPPATETATRDESVELEHTARRGGRPAGSRTRRGSQGGEAAIIERLKR